MANTAVFSHPACSRHDTGWRHPEHQGRLRAVTGALERAMPAWAPDVETLSGSLVDPAVLELAHTGVHVRNVRRAAEAARVRNRPISLEADTVVCGASWEAATAAVGCVIDAVEAVARRRSRNAFCIVRPPGHHATASRAMGFCLFNSIAIGARYARQLGLANRVLIVDWDVHHGNGTQEIFYSDPDVFYVSVHQSPFYPGTGTREERGAGPAEGTTLNVPLPPGLPPPRYMDEWLAALDEAAAFRPDLVLISAGFDAGVDDPIGGFTLREEHFRALTLELDRLTRSSAQGRIVSALEGGYQPEELGRNVVAHIGALLDSRVTCSPASDKEVSAS